MALVAAGVAVVLVFVPPVWGAAHHYVFAEAAQFCLAAFAVPGLFVVGHPWTRAGRTSRLWSIADRLGRARQRHPSLARSLAFVAVQVAAVVAWRTPAAVDALSRHGWLVAVEVVSLAIAGVGLWLELVVSPPLSPRLERPWRAALAAACMWAMWIVAYMLAFAHGSWYSTLRHADAPLGFAADQQIAAGVLFFGGLLAFMPVVFADVLAWMRSEGDPDAELRRLVRAERRAGRWRGPGG